MRIIIVIVLLLLLYRHLAKALACPHCSKLKELHMGGSQAGEDIMVVLCNISLASEVGG